MISYMATVYNNYAINSVNVTNSVTDGITTTTNTILMSPYSKYIEDTTNTKYVTELLSNRIEYPITWNDLVIDLSRTNITNGITAPSFTTITGLDILYVYDLTIDKELFFTAQLPHNWIIGSELRPYLHCIPENMSTVSGSRQSKMMMTLTVSILDQGNTVEELSKTISAYNGPTNVFYADNSTQNNYSGSDLTLENNKHCIIEFQSISPADLSGKTISSILLCRLRRENTDGADLTDYNLKVLSFEFHYQSKYNGSVE